MDARRWQVSEHTCVLASAFSGSFCVACHESAHLRASGRELFVIGVDGVFRLGADVTPNEAAEGLAACFNGLADRYRLEGAAALGGLIGMALAIQENGPRLVERYYWTSEFHGRVAGAHEGTDLEWCGVCRDSR